MTNAWVLQKVEVRGLGRALALALAGSLVVAVLARVQIPYAPVPITGQTFGVLLVGALFGARLGALALGLYLLEGAMGLPVFARGGGIAYLLGPTGGYLLAFPAAAYLAGAFFERGAGRRPLVAFGSLLLSVAVVFAVGVPWLALYLGADVPRALAVGLYPFLPGELLKVALLVLVLRRFYR